MFGAGYVGLVTGACFADLGHEVVIRDVVPGRIERLLAGEVPIYEPGLELVLERNKDRIRFTLDIAEAVDGAEFLYVAVGTPPTESGDADLAAVFSVIDEVPSAEFVKLASNAFLSTRISFINEIANVCELVGADVVDVARGVGLDHRLGPHFLRAGIGFGGSCFPKDVTALKQLAGNSGYQFMLLHAVWEVNELQKRRVVQKLEKHLGALRGKRIALLGLAFKPNTDDMREAPSRVIAYRLLSEGAEVRAWDPVARPEDLRGIELCDTVLEAVRDADAAVVVTEWPELRSLVSAEVHDAMARPVLIDGRNLLDPVAAHAAGFVYEGIGRPKHASAPEPHAPR